MHPFSPSLSLLATAELRQLRKEIAGELSEDEEANTGAGRLTFDPSTTAWDSGDEGNDNDTADAHQRGQAFSSKVNAPVSVAVRGTAAAKLLQATTASRLNVLSDESDDESEADKNQAVPSAKAAPHTAKASQTSGIKANAKAAGKPNGGVSKEALVAFGNESDDEESPGPASKSGSLSNTDSAVDGGTSANPWLKTASSTVGLTPQLIVGDKSTRQEKREAKLQRNRHATATDAATSALVRSRAKGGNGVNSALVLSHSPFDFFPSPRERISWRRRFRKQLPFRYERSSR